MKTTESQSKREFKWPSSKRPCATPNIVQWPAGNMSYCQNCGWAYDWATRTGK